VAKAKPLWDREWGGNIDISYVTDQLWSFKTAISEGDVMIVYSESRVLGIAEVTRESEYQYGEKGPISYENQMNVRYRWYEKWPKRADSKIVETLGKQGTLRVVKEEWLWNYLVKKLS
jgi:predicted Mrr-cat superfamily restriction endonuclease